jgi:integrase
MATIRKLRGRWQAQVRRRGIPPRAKSFDRKSKAERWARELEAEADRSGWLTDTRAAEKTTLGELLGRYVNQVTPAKRGAIPERARINAIVRRPIALRSLAKLASSDLATYRDERLKSAAPATVVRELSTISHAIEVAASEWGIWLPRNPVSRIRRPALPRGRTRRLLGDEEVRLLAACAESCSPFLKPLLIVAIESAMRRGELLGLLWQDVDFGLRVVHLRQSKNGDCRDVPLSRRAIVALRELNPDANRQGYVFPMTGNSVRSAFGRLVSLTEIQNLRFHDLRHEAISRLFEKGLNPIEVAAISGHRELRMLQRYTHLRAADLAPKLDRSQVCGPSLVVQS